MVIKILGVYMTENGVKQKRKIGFFYGIITGLGATLGIEFLVLIDYATQLAGPSIIFSLILSGLINLIIMFNYAELSSCISKVGAEYTFTKVAFGGLICFLSGWLRWLSSIFTTTLSALGLAFAIKRFLPIDINEALIAVILIAVFTLLSIKGGRFIDLVTVLSFIIIFLIIGLQSVNYGLDFGNFSPFMPNGFYPGVLAGTMYTFSMYVGMRAISTKSPVMKEPGKILPKSILVSSLISIIVYSLIAFFIIGIIPLNSNTSDYLTFHLGRVVMGPIGEILVMIAWVSASFMSLATSISVQTSIISALSRDGYLPNIIFSSDSSSLTRYITQITGSLIAMFFAATGVIIFVGYAAGFASLIVFALVNFSLIKLRRSQPTLDRPFKTPLYPLTPIFGIFISFILMIFIEGSAIIVVLAFIMIGLMIYHLKMIGYNRLRMALGGVNLGISGLISLILYLILSGTIDTLQQQHIIVSVGIILIITFLIAGLLNLIRGKRIITERIEV
jgi:APA family basic amino acid/polyamine antiporter